MFARMEGLREVTLPDDADRPVPASPEVRARLEALFRDPKGLRRLYGIARKIVRLSGGIQRDDHGNALYSGDILENLVSEAITRVLEGRRKWDLAKQPDAHVYLGGVIGSLWTHFCEAERARRDNEAVPDDEAAFDWRTRNPPTPLQLLIAKEEEEEYQLLCEDFEAEFKPGDKALQFLALTQDGIYDPNEQARRLRLTIKETYRLRERVKRTLDRFLEQRKRRNKP
jgi:hypothetical protein